MKYEKVTSTTIIGNMEVTEKQSITENETADFPNPNSATTAAKEQPENLQATPSSTKEASKTITPVELEDSPAMQQGSSFLNDEFCFQKSPLSSLEELSKRLMEVRINVEDPDSYTTVDFCNKEKATTTNGETRFSRNSRTQNIIVGRSNIDDRPPPPYPEPYYYQGQLQSTPIYQEYSGYNRPPPQDTRRSPAYLPNLVNIFNPFDDRSIRNRFIHKVYTILSLQLLIAFGIIACCCFHAPARRFVQQDRIIWIVSLVVYLIVVILIYCVKSVRRAFPANYLLLMVLTLTLAYTIAYIAVNIHKNAVLMSFGITFAVTLLITFVAWQNWCDVTSWGMILGIASLVVMVYGLIAMIVTLVTGSRIFYLVYACISTVLFCVYLLYDTQQILGGGRIAMSPEEYILGAVTLFVDIMYIFMNILYIFGFSRA